VYVKNVSRESIARRDTTQDKRDLAVRLCVLTEVVEAYHRIITSVSNTLANCNANKHDEEVDDGSGRRVRGNDEQVVVEHDGSYQLTQLAQIERHTDIHAEYSFRAKAINRSHIIEIVAAQHSIQEYRRLTCRSVAQNELTLTSTNRQQGVYQPNTSYQGFVHLTSQGYAHSALKYSIICHSIPTASKNTHKKKSK
jgi:hypothetical protein